jgi:hypothetical protein
MVPGDALYMIGERPTVEQGHQRNEKRKKSDGIVAVCSGDFEPGYTHILNAPVVIHGSEFLTSKFTRIVCPNYRRSPGAPRSELGSEFRSTYPAEVANTQGLAMTMLN